MADQYINLYPCLIANVLINLYSLSFNMFYNSISLWGFQLHPGFKHGDNDQVPLFSEGSLVVDY